MGFRWWLAWCVACIAVGCGDAERSGSADAGDARGADAGGDGGAALDAGDFRDGAVRLDAALDGSRGEDDASVADDAATRWMEPVEVIDLDALPASVPTVAIEVDTASLAQLEASPYSAADVPGVFIDESGTRYEGIDLNFRGAYALRSLIQSGGPQRNWKVKVASTQPYRGRREWNFSYEPHPRQKLAYDLMGFAGVKVPSARHVLLKVNGAAHGLYLEYEDPDNKGWLRDKFADDTGDLFKAATDLPGFPRYFATTEYLGDTDADYAQHYTKKTNHKALPVSYATLREFLDGLNHTPAPDFAAWIAAHFDVPKFIRYLVVANFISNWDGLPQRPKNYWLYQIPAASRWVFIPWDLDGSFQVGTFGLNPMGTTASVLYQLDAYEPYSAEQGEGTERPLVRRLLAVTEFRTAYLDHYREALGTYLDPTYLAARVTALEQLLVNAASSSDDTKVQNAANEMRQFIQARHTHVSAELDGL